MSDAAELRHRAHDILRQRRFHGRKTPAPFRGVLRWLGERLAPVFRPVAQFYGWIIRLWSHTASRVAVIAFVILLVALLSRVVIRRRGAAALSGGGRRVRGRSEDPTALEREADRAEAERDYESAIRLRFRAGVIRLQLAGRVKRGSTLATRAIGRELGSPVFDALGETFDAVAYGGIPADDLDARASRDAWARVLSEASS